MTGGNSDRSRILLMRTRYAHWSRHAALNAFATSIDAGKFDIRERLVANGDDDFPLQARPVKVAARAAVTTRRMPFYHLSDFSAEAGAFGEAVRRRVDVIHFLDGEHGARFLPSLLRLLPLSTRTVATFHQPPELLDRTVSERVVRKLDRATVVAPHQLDWFTRRMGPERVELILHPANVDFFRPAAPGEARSMFRCITVGHWLRDWEAVGSVARLLAGHRDIHFDLVTGRETGCESLENVAHHRGVSDEKLRSLYQRADVLLLPLHSATANNSLLEGIACGLPVVTSDIPGMRAYLPEHAGFFVADNDPSEIAERILHLRDRPDLREAMGRRARKGAEALSWPRIAPRYEALYAQLA